MLNSNIFRSTKFKQIFDWQPLLKVGQNQNISHKKKQNGGTKICLIAWGKFFIYHFLYIISVHTRKSELLQILPFDIL